MVVSKRCKICALIQADNISITGEYYGKAIPSVISRICGIEVDFRKANEVLVCQMCAIQLVHADMFIDKLRKAVQRLKKNVRESKPKTPTKNTSTPVAKKKAVLNKTVGENGDQETDKFKEDGSQSFAGDTGTLTDITLKIPKKPRRKSEFRDVPPTNKIDCNESINNVKFTKFFDDMVPIEKTPAKASKRKALATSEAHEHNSDGPTPIKNTKISKECENESPMNLAIEQNGNDEKCQKVKNCILCGKIFHANSALRSHIETAHMGERLKSCPHCSSEFRSKQKYESHVFSEKCKSTIHACQYDKCNKRFKTVHKMEMHMLEKHSA